jgi:hypothetical protein
MKVFLTLLSLVLTASSTFGLCQNPLIDFEEEAVTEVESVLKEIFDVRRDLDSAWDKFIFGFQRAGFKMETRRS